MTGEPRIEHQLQSPCQQTKLWKQVAPRQVALCHFRHQSHLQSHHPPPFQCFSPGATMIAMRIQKGATTWRVIQVWQWWDANTSSRDLPNMAPGQRMWHRGSFIYNASERNTAQPIAHVCDGPCKSITKRWRIQCHLSCCGHVWHVKACRPLLDLMLETLEASWGLIGFLGESPKTSAWLLHAGGACGRGFSCGCGCTSVCQPFPHLVCFFFCYSCNLLSRAATSFASLCLCILLLLLWVLVPCRSHCCCFLCFWWRACASLFFF